MSPERREAVIAVVQAQWLARPLKVRNLSFVGLVLCGALAVMLIGVALSGATGSEDVMVPAVLSGAFALSLGGTFVYALSQARSVRAHPLFSALRAEPPRIAKAVPITVHGAGGPWSGVSIQLADGTTHTIFVDPRTQAELCAWLSPR